MLDARASAFDAAIRGCAVAVSHELTTVQLSPSTGYIEGEIVLIDGSRLTFFEFLRHRWVAPEREKYRYQLMDAGSGLVFRYDNAPHHSDVSTFPHHKHVPRGVGPSHAPDFEEVLAEVQDHVLGILEA